MCTPECISEKLGGLAFDEAIKAWKYVRHYTENLQELQVKLRDLDDCTATISREVSEAIGRNDEIEVSVTHWRTDADSLKDNIEQLIGERTTKASISCIACSCPNIVWRYKFSKQAEEKKADADALIGKYNNFNHQISHPSSHYMENHQKLKDKLRDLGNCREIIRREVSEANGRGDKIEVNVSQWQTDADNLLDNSEQLIRESTYICSTECPCPDITWQYKFSKQAEEKIADADELIIKYNNFNQISHPRPRPPELESLSDKNYVNFDSRASIFKDIMDALKDSNVNMIGVFGLGGVGKTTLVKEVGKQMQKDGTFKQVAMAVVSKDLNVKEVQSRLAASVNFKFKAEVDDQVGRATELWNKLTNGDKYLIILDDIWQEVKMKAIGIPCTDEKKCCKVVLTSRNEDLLSRRMEVDRNFSIAILSSTEAWTLLMKKVGNTIESQQEIKSLANEVCERCKGLPVAINALGEALQGKQEHAWKTALNKLDKYMLKNIVDINPSVFASLRVSYDMLHSKDAKSCFLLCCLFAEDAEIPLDELTRFCFAGSFLDQNPCTLEEARNDVLTVVDALKSASLLSNGNDENVVKIHDVIRDVGISIARDEEAFLVDHGALRWPQSPPNGPSYSAISLIFKNVNEHPDGLLYPKLHTLTFVNSELSDLGLPDNFFNGMMQLTVFTVSGIRMRRLPSSLAKLKNLRMLYLNKCELDDIAILKDLKSNLEVLSLSDSSIEALPSEIRQLTSLRVLDLRDCDKLRVIPRGVISNLTSLEELYFPEYFAEWGATTNKLQDTSSKDNTSLEELRWLLKDGHLTTLHIHIPDVKLLPKEDLKFANLKRFRISVGSKFYYYEAFISRTCMLKLEGIQSRNEFIHLVDKAEVLVLKPESSVHPLRLFNKLTVLIIEHFKLKYLFSPSTARGLAHLEVLEVTYCEIMEGIVGFEGQKDENEITGEVKFSKLKQLKLTSLPNLISFFAEKEEMGTTMGSFSARAQPLFNEQVIFPALEGLTIDGLGNIIKIWDKQSIAILEEQGSFCQLTDLQVKCCSKLIHVFPPNMHPLLKNLEGLVVKDCETMKGIAEFEGEIDEDGLRNEVASPARDHLEMVGVTEIQDRQSLAEPRKEVESLCRPVNNDDIIVFPRLKEVELWDLPKLKSFYSETQGFFSLKKLCVEGCPNVESIFFKNAKEKEAAYASPLIIPRLWYLRISNMEKLKSFYSSSAASNAQSLFNHQVILPVLEVLEVDRLCNIVEIWDKQSPSVNENTASSGKLRDVKVQRCEKLTNLVPSNILPRLDNLQKLCVEGCPKIESVVFKNENEGAADDDSTMIIPKLQYLRISDMEKLKSFYSSSTASNARSLFNHQVILPLLEVFEVDRLGNIVEIWDKQSPWLNEHTVSSFKLRDMNVQQCKTLMNLVPSNILPRLQLLQKLYVEGCPKIESILFENEKEVEAADASSLIIPQLRYLRICNMEKLKSFYSSSRASNAQSLFNHQVSLPNLEVLHVSNLENLERLGHGPLSAGSLSKLKQFSVRCCSKLLCVFPSQFLPMLRELQELAVESCHSLDVVFQLEGLFPSNILPNLQKLCVDGCPKIESVVFKNEKEEVADDRTLIIPQLRYLRISDMEKLKSFYSSSTASNAHSLFNHQVSLPNLEVLHVNDLENLERLGHGPLSAGSLSKLKEFSVHCCSKLLCVFPSQFLPMLRELQELTVKSCHSLEVALFQLEGLVPSNILPNLQKLCVEGCPNIESIVFKNGKEEEAADRSSLIIPRLWYLRISDMENLKTFYSSSTASNAHSLFNHQVTFPILENLELEGCASLRNIFHPYMVEVLENLGELMVNDCSKMESVIDKEEEVKDRQQRKTDKTLFHFHHLSKLELCRLPELRTFCHFTRPLELPLLCEMVICDCPSMDSFSSGHVSTPNLSLKGVSLYPKKRPRW